MNKFIIVLQSYLKTFFVSIKFENYLIPFNVLVLFISLRSMRYVSSRNAATTQYILQLHSTYVAVVAYTHSRLSSLFYYVAPGVLNVI